MSSKGLPQQHRWQAGIARCGRQCSIGPFWSCDLSPACWRQNLCRLSPSLQRNWHGLLLSCRGFISRFDGFEFGFESHSKFVHYSVANLVKFGKNRFPIRQTRLMNSSLGGSGTMFPSSSSVSYSGSVSDVDSILALSFLERVWFLMALSSSSLILLFSSLSSLISCRRSSVPPSGKILCINPIKKVNLIPQPYHPELKCSHNASLEPHWHTCSRMVFRVPLHLNANKN